MEKTEAVEYVTLEWVHWFNNIMLPESIENIFPAKFEKAYYNDLLSLLFSTGPSSYLYFFSVLLGGIIFLISFITQYIAYITGYTIDISNSRLNSMIAEDGEQGRSIHERDIHHRPEYS